MVSLIDFFTYFLKFTPLLWFVFISPLVTYWKCGHMSIYECLYTTLAFMTSSMIIGFAYATLKIDGPVSTYRCCFAGLANVLITTSSTERCLDLR